MLSTHFFQGHRMNLVFYISMLFDLMLQMNHQDIFGTLDSTMNNYSHIDIYYLPIVGINCICLSKHSSLAYKFYWLSCMCKIIHRE